MEEDLEFLDLCVTFNYESFETVSYSYYEGWSFTENLIEMLKIKNVISSRAEAILNEKGGYSVNSYSLYLHLGCYWHDLSAFVSIDTYGKRIFKIDQKLLKGKTVRVARR